MTISAAERIRDLLQTKTVGGFVGISLEMSKESIATRAACAYAGVPVETVIHGRLTDMQLEQLKEARAKLRNLPIELIAAGGLTPTMIKMRLRQARRKFGGKIAMVIIDHVQLVNADDKDNKGGGAWATGKIADALLALGKEFGCCTSSPSPPARSERDFEAARQEAHQGRPALVGELGSERRQRPLYSSAYPLRADDAARTKRH